MLKKEKNRVERKEGRREGGKGRVGRKEGEREGYNDYSPENYIRSSQE